MAGLSQTDDFMLATATVMIGPVEDLYNLNPTDHAIGLVKNFTATSEPAYTDLTQGVKNTVVFSVMTANPVKATMEVYEYTAKNLGYSLGLEGADTFEPFSVSTTTSSSVAGGSPASVTLPVVSAASLAADDYILIAINEDDNFCIRKIVSISGTSITVNAELPAIPSGTAVKKVHGIGVGSKADQPFYAAKIAGKLVNGDEVILLIPKLRIVKGFNMAFTTDNYANLPIEFTVYDLVPTDTFYADFGGDQAKLFRT